MGRSTGGQVKGIEVERIGCRWTDQQVDEIEIAQIEGG